MASPEGFESDTGVVTTRTHVDSSAEHPPRVDVSARRVDAIRPDPEAAVNPLPDSFGDVERALAEALRAAALAGRWDVVTQLARELEARRVPLPT